MRLPSFITHLIRSPSPPSSSPPLLSLRFTNTFENLRHLQQVLSSPHHLLPNIYSQGHQGLGGWTCRFWGKMNSGIIMAYRSWSEQSFSLSGLYRHRRSPTLASPGCMKGYSPGRRHHRHSQVSPFLPFHFLLISSPLSCVSFAQTRHLVIPMAGSPPAVFPQNIRETAAHVIESKLVGESHDASGDGGRGRRKFWNEYGCASGLSAVAAFVSGVA